MKIIEALKNKKDLLRKAQDLRGKIKQYCADMTHEPPTYGSEQGQRDQISAWLQAHHDILKEISKLGIAIQKTNLNTPVTIELGGHSVEKSISEWIIRRRDLAKLEYDAWDCLSDRSLPAVGQIAKTSGEKLDVKLRRYYDPAVRDQKRELYMSEKSLIDGRLEVINAITDLMM